MSDILGHDIDGRPLRSGDEVVVVMSTQGRNVGKRVKVLGFIGELPDFLFGERVSVDADILTSEGRFVNHVALAQIRKLRADREPSGESFSEMMSKLKGEPA